MSNQLPTHSGVSLTAEDGAVFQLWAPHAESVNLAGTFNDWKPDSNRMEPIGEGLWRTEIEGVEAGDEYKFVIRNGDRELWRNDPAARAVTNSAGNSIVVDDEDFDWENDSEFQMRAWNELVVYEMHPGTYHRGSETDSPGTFDDAIERLDHLVNLGINVIELMPVSEFAGGISWGYNPAFPFAVESDYGGPDGFKRFVKACHSRGIAVILDVVYNHFGPGDLEMWQFDGWSENGMGGIYFYNDWRANTPWGDTRPDYGRDEVRQYIRDNAMMWLDRYHVDGLRLDMTFYMRSVRDGEDIPEGWSLAQWINHDIREQYPGAITIAEDLRSNHWITKSTGDGGAGFGCQWDEQFVHPIRDVLTAQEDSQRSMERVARSLTYSYNGDPFQRVVYTESHDEVANGKDRVPSEVDEYDQEGYWARKRSALGACLVMTSPGIPMIFQGQELLATGHFEDSSELNWEKGHIHPGIVRLYRDLIRLRANQDGISSALQGNDTAILHLNDDGKVIAYSRGNGDDRMMIIMNFSQTDWGDYRVPFPDGGLWNLIFHCDSDVYSEDFGGSESFDLQPEANDRDGQRFSASVGLGSYDCLIYKRS